MGEDLTVLIETVRKIHDLVELLAEEKIAQRDAKQRIVLRQIVGSSPVKQKSVLLMTGALSQQQIHTKTGVNRGNLSTLLGKMQKAGLLVGKKKMPKLAISIPSNFFETS